MELIRQRQELEMEEVDIDQQRRMLSQRLSNASAFLEDEYTKNEEFRPFSVCYPFVFESIEMIHISHIAICCLLQIGKPDPTIPSQD